MRIIALTFLLACAAMGALSAQDRSGTLTGTVRDQSGGVLPGVLVTAVNTQNGARAVATSDRAGAYSLEHLAPGSYRVRAELTGFTPSEVQARVDQGGSAAVDFSLAVAPLAETVTVTRSEQTLATVPNAVTIVDGADIQTAQRRVSPAEALAGVPGLLAQNRHNFSASGGMRLAIRAPLQGSGMRGVTLVQDGIPITTADGTNQPTNLALGSAGRAEIVRGPSSVLYGNSAGGVVSLYTEYPSSERLNVQPDVQFGSYGYDRQQVKAEGTSGAFGYLVDASRMQVDGYRTHSAGDIRQANVALRAAVSSATEIRGVFNLFDMPFGESPSTLTRADARNNPRTVRPQALTEGWGESSQQGQGGVTIEHQFAGERHVRATAWGMWRDTWNPIPSRVIDLGRTGAGLRSEYQGAMHAGTLPIAWTTGFDFSYQHDDRHEFQNAGVKTPGGMTTEGALLLNQLEQVSSAAPFGQLTIALHPRWHVTAGLRYDFYRFRASDRFLSDGDQSGERTMHAASPKAGVTFTASDSLNLYSNVSAAYQTPTTVELSNRPTGEGGFNTDLNPATLKSVEAGARGLIHDWRLRYEVAGYISGLDDAFVSFQRPDEQVFYVNAARSTRNGVETLLEWTPVAHVKTRLSYTFQDFRFDKFVTATSDFSGNKEPGAPRHQAYLSGAYDAPFGLHTSAQMRWLDAYVLDNANTAFDWSSTVTDLRIGLDRKWKGATWRPFLGIDNLFNVRYNASTSPNAVAARYYEPAPGREVYVGVTLLAGVF
jgi:iron complex outermembrane receptor protein